MCRCVGSSVISCYCLPVPSSCWVECLHLLYRGSLSHGTIVWNGLDKIDLYFFLSLLIGNSLATS